MGARHTLTVTAIMLILSVLPAAAAPHSAYPGFAQPHQSYSISSRNFSFATGTEQAALSISASDDAVYRYAYVSIGGGTWTSVPLQGSALGGAWLNGSATGQLSLSASNFSLSVPGTSARRNFVIVYSCSRSGSAWECYGGWQIWQFNASMVQQDPCSGVQCDDGNQCTADSCSAGSCSHQSVGCVSSDSCCPGGCTSANDSDCADPCAGVDCGDGNACTTDSCTGGSCSNVAITSCASGDSCCPAGCSYPSDADCNQCTTPITCPAGTSCQTKTCAGTPARCGLASITACASGDSCCPSGCTYPSDTDCTAPPSGYIIIDHTCTNVSRIPDYWLAQAKKLSVHYAHTSHGSQVLSGMEKLEQVNSKYNVAILVMDTVGLPTDTAALRFYDGNNLGGGNTYITPDLYWEGSSGMQYTRSAVNTRLFNYSTWTWCGQASSYTTTQIQTYLGNLNQLEAEYPSTRFIYFTGHSDGTDTSGTLYRNNNMIRDYVRSNNKILFDFNDIETYDPLGGGPYYNNGDGTCQWCVAFCSAHPEYCTDLPSSCAHTDSPAQATLFCKLKGAAFWWLMARLSGWDGVSG